MSKTSIEWTEETLNPTVGCMDIGPGCVHCYAKKMALRLKKMGRPEYQDVVTDDGKWTGVVKFIPARLKQVIQRQKPTMWFVDSMSDLFHESVTTDQILQCLLVFQAEPQHTFQILTKRYERVPEVLKVVRPSKNIWFGNSICTQRDFEKAIPYLRQVAKAGWTTFVSYEPALEEIDWTGAEFLKWMICGGESGPGHRRFEWSWMRSAYRYCLTHGIKFFAKQGGGFPDKRDRLEDIPEDMRVREYPE